MMNKLKPWLLLVLVFFAGIAVGVIGTRSAARHFLPARVMNPGWIQERMERELSAVLALTPEQQVKVQEIFANSKRDLQELREKFGPRFGEVMKKAEKEIAATLTPEQQVKYENFLKEKRAMWRPPGDPAKPPLGSRRPMRERGAPPPPSPHGEP